MELNCVFFRITSRLLMAGTYDNEKQRLADRIKCVAFREARDSGAQFINKHWIAEKLGRSESWVKRTWNKSVDECFTDFGEGRPLKLSQESRNIVSNSSGMQKKSCSQVARQILDTRNKSVVRQTVRNYRIREGLKPFHVISKPLKTETHVRDRLWLADWLRNWGEEDFLHLAPSDEFFIWSIRKPNFQNDRIWSKNLEDIADNDHFRQIVHSPSCIGIFVMFTAKKMLWVIKEHGQSWDGAYFRNVILVENVIPFLNDPDNVLVVGETTFLHDKAPCMRANATQQLLKENGIDYWGNDIWPGNSPDLNAAESIGAIIKDEVETLMLKESGQGRYSKETLQRNLENVLRSLENREDLFLNLLCSYPNRFKAVLRAQGGHTEY